MFKTYKKIRYQVSYYRNPSILEDRQDVWKSNTSIVVQDSSAPREWFECLNSRSFAFPDRGESTQHELCTCPSANMWCAWWPVHALDLKLHIRTYMVDLGLSVNFHNSVMLRATSSSQFDEERIVMLLPSVHEIACFWIICDSVFI